MKKNRKTGGIEGSNEIEEVDRGLGKKREAGAPPAIAGKRKRGPRNACRDRKNDAVRKLVFDLARHADHVHEPLERFERLARHFQGLNDVRVRQPTLLRKARSVRAAIYKVKSFTRLQPAGNDVLVGTFESRHLVVDRVAMHFHRRFPGFNVILLNVARRTGCVVFNSQGLKAAWLGSPLERRLAWKARDARVLDVPGGVLLRVPAAMDTASLPGLLVRFIARLRQVSDNHPAPVASVGSASLGEITASGGNSNDENGIQASRDSPVGGFGEAWEAYYDSQVIDERVDHRRATRMYGKAWLARLGTPLEKARILKRVDRHQRTLLDDL